MIVEVKQIDPTRHEPESSSTKSQYQLQQQAERDPPVVDHLLLMSLSNEEGHMTCTDFLLMTNERSHLEALLYPNTDIFAWTHLDMPRIDSSMATHKLNIILNICHMRQKV